MKNNSNRALPAKRTVGSVVRRPTPDNSGKQSGADQPSSAKTNSNIDNGGTNPVCNICAQSVPGPERENIYALGKCDHRVCYVCSARLRAICDQQECPICRVKLDDVIFSANKTIPFDQCDLKTFEYDTKHRIYFENEKIRAAFEKLLAFECLECLKRIEKSADSSKNHDDKKQSSEQDSDSKRQDANNVEKTTQNSNRVHRNPFPNVQKLKNHLDMAHKLRLCDLCLTHNNLFPYEFSYYDNDSLRKHVQRGEPNTSHRGHPRCKLCNNIFFNLDELIQHMSREHFHCHLCGRHNTTQHIYFIDYASLRSHFRTKHFLCERDNCRHEQFTSAFDTQVDYQLHLVQVHDTSTNLSRGEARQHRTVTLESAPHRQAHSARQDNLPSNAAVVTTGTLATANDPRRQIPESIQTQIRQQRLPSNADFPALGNAHQLPLATSQNLSQQTASMQQRSSSDTITTSQRFEAGPSNSRVSFLRSMGGHGRPPNQLNEMDFPPLPEQPKKQKPGNKSKGSDNSNINKTKATAHRSGEMTLDQLISSSLTLSARNNRSNNKTNKSNKSTKHRPIKIQL